MATEKGTPFRQYLYRSSPALERWCERSQQLHYFRQGKLRCDRDFLRRCLEYNKSPYDGEDALEVISAFVAKTYLPYDAESPQLARTALLSGTFAIRVDDGVVKEFGQMQQREHIRHAGRFFYLHRSIDMYLQLPQWEIHSPH